MNHWERRIDHLDKIANIESSNLTVFCGYSYMAIMYMHTYMQCIFQYSIIYGIPCMRTFMLVSCFASQHLANN